MKKRIIFASALLFGLFGIMQLVLPTRVLAAEKAGLPVPTILVPQEGYQTDTEKPIIRGVTVNDTNVAVYIDGVFNGNAEVKNDASGTASFVYTPFLDLTVGSHTLQARAEDVEKGSRSELSSAVSIDITAHYIAPTIVNIVVNKETTNQRPLIVGVAKNQSYIQVFIDNKLNGEFYLDEGTSETADFAYKPFLSLDPTKDHIVYAVAADASGKQSLYSNAFGFKVAKNQVKKVTTTTTTVTTTTAVTPEETVVDVPPTREEPRTATEVPVENNETTNESSDTLTENETPVSPIEKEIVENEDENANTNTSEVVSTTENTNSNEEAAGEDDQKNSTRSWVVWIIIIVLIVIMLFRGRDSIQARLKNSEGESKDKTTEALGKIIGKDTKDSNSSKGDKNNLPPPPPNA